MEDISIIKDVIFLKQIALDDANKLFSWYSKEQGYAHATGLNTGLSWQEFHKMWNDAATNDEEFFLSIHHTKIDDVLGFVKGVVINNGADSVIFITSLAVNKEMRRRKIGTTAINALLSDLKKRKGCNIAYVTVDFANKVGIKFWHEIGFNNVKTFEKPSSDGKANYIANLMKKDL